MSAESKAALDTAIANHIADEGDGHFLTGYVLLACGVTAENLNRGSTQYFAEFHEGQPFHSALGLAQKLVNDLNWPDEPEDEDDDDD